MHIEELRECLEGRGQDPSVRCEPSSDGLVVVSEAKRVLVGAGARALFYPTLVYNVLRNRVQAEFRWWDRVDEFLLLGAVPFPADVPKLRELGVGGVVTLNEPYETLVSTSLYHASSIDHLVLPTRDYLFAPSYPDICLAVDFIHKNANLGRTTYVHCKAGRGRSTTIVLCYLVKHKHMMPESAYHYVKSIRPRVLLASSQWQAVLDYYRSLTGKYDPMTGETTKISREVGSSDAEADLPAFDDGSVVVVTESDLEGYSPKDEKLGIMSNSSHLAMSRLSCLWSNRYSDGKKQGSSTFFGVHILGNLGIGIKVY